MTKIFKTPFGALGDKQEVPVSTQTDGSVSYEQGFGVDYQRDYEDPQAKDIPREGLNQLFYDVTKALGQVQVQGAATWSPDGAPYPINAQVYHDGKQWIALRPNSVEPAEGDDWRVALRPATPDQARELTAGDVAITPETLGAAMNAHVLGMGQAYQNMGEERAAETTYTNTTGRPIYVAITCRALNGYTRLQLTVDGLSVSFVSSGGAYSSETYEYSTAWGVVPAGSTYRLNIVTGSLQTWVELK